MGQWAARSDGSWDWDPTPADPSVTYMLPSYAGGSPMADYRDQHDQRDQGQQPRVPRSIYDPSLGADGGGHYADPEPLPTIDPQTDQDWPPPDWAPEHDERRGGTPQSYAAPTPDLVCCPTCGTGVNPDRLRD